jgi:hypothetical protein
MKTKSLLFVLLASLGLTTPTMAQNLPSYVPANGIVGWWPFNGNANDESGNGNNGAVNGAILTNDRFGNANEAYGFDGVDDFIQINNINCNNNWSISLWFNSQNTSQFQQQYLIGTDFNTVSNNANGIGISGSLSPALNGNKVFSYDGQTFLQNVSIGFEYQNQIFNHLVVVNEGDSHKVYLNNSTNNPTLLNDINIDSLFVGKRLDDVFPFLGSIDDIGIWDRALDSLEVSNLFNANICYQTITVTDTLLINTGIITYNPVTYNNTIKIFPNPTNDHITIDYGNFTQMNGYQLRIENSLGQEVFQTSITQQSDYLNLNSWGGNGLYFVHIVDPQGNTIDIRKIVLQ